MAGEQVREIFAVPGSPLDSRARGTKDLLRRGANLCETAQDIIDILEPMIGFEAPRAPLEYCPASALSIYAPPIRPMPIGQVDHARKQLMALLSQVPTSLDDLVRRSNLPISLVMAAMSELEITAQVESTAQGFIQVG